MTTLKTTLIAMTAIVAVTTTAAMSKEGIDFLSPFLAEIMALGWQGQFNLDFACYLVLSALWIAWRHGFSLGGFLIAGLAALLGILVFAPYVLVQISRAEGDPRRLLMGVHAVPRTV
ncbi:hypothetical protein [Shimia biformata]|uniref:hypothetical protein n=1 Tax=Shimia biformata TaxID=1294299 RepID=UPI00194F1890|nr:hypothetical protein [Shimia biformata]